MGEAGLRRLTSILISVCQNEIAPGNGRRGYIVGYSKKSIVCDCSNGEVLSVPDKVLSNVTVRWKKFLDSN